MTEQGNSAGLQGVGTIRVAVSGARGRMGAMTCAAVAGDTQLSLIAVVDPLYACDERPSGPATSTDGRPECFSDLLESLHAVRPQVVVDFTTPTTVLANVITCVRERVPVVVGTTGLSAGDLADIQREVEANDTPVLVAPNFAMGAVLMMQFAQLAARHLKAC